MGPEIPSTISMEKDAGPEGASPDMDSTEEGECNRDPIATFVKS